MTGPRTKGTMRASRSDLSLSLSLERLPLDVPRPCWSDGPGHCRPADEPITDPLALLTDILRN